MAYRGIENRITNIECRILALRSPDLFFEALCEVERGEVGLNDEVKVKRQK